ncbi:MAG: c-type cytochrome domain-containing protein [Puniceicoccales bacterium]
MRVRASFIAAGVLLITDVSLIAESPSTLANRAAAAAKQAQEAADQAATAAKLAKELATEIDSIDVPGEDPHAKIALAAVDIIDFYCADCHGIDRRKGGYRVDVPRLARIGGNSGRLAIIPGDPDKGEFMRRLTLPRDADHVMPPKNEVEPMEEELETLREWIALGAPFPGENEGKVDRDPEVIRQIEALQEIGWAADFTPWSNAFVLIDLRFIDAPDWKLARPAMLPLVEELVWLDASNHDWPKAFYTDLPTFENLQRLHLANTNVSADDLDEIVQLKNLTYLNLNGTKLTAKDLQAIVGMPHLQQLYASDVAASPEELETLSKKRGNLAIISQPYVAEAEEPQKK